MPDKYANTLFKLVTESSANTLTFDAVDIGLSLFDKVGVLIHRLEWESWNDQLTATADRIQFGLSTSNGFTVVNSGETSIITMHDALIKDYGTAGVNILYQNPWVDDFTTLPGGGLLVTPKPMYMFVLGTSLPNAGGARMRMYFTIVTLKAEEYFELLETRHYFG